MVQTGCPSFSSQSGFGLSLRVWLQLQPWESLGGMSSGGAFRGFSRVSHGIFQHREAFLHPGSPWVKEPVHVPIITLSLPLLQAGGGTSGT